MEGKPSPAADSRRQSGHWGRIAAAMAAVLRDHIRPNLHRWSEERQPLVWVVALVVGICVAYAAILFRLAIGLFQLPWLGTMSERVFEAATGQPWWVILLAPAACGLVIGLALPRLMPDRRPHAVADVIEARAIHDCRIAPRDGLWSAVVSAFSLGMGASAGREGPVVHLGAAIASMLENTFDLPAHARRTLLAAGVAAAVSASFNAPLAGVLFAHEVILGHYALRAFVPIVISSVAGTVIMRHHFGDFPAFILEPQTITSLWEFPAFALLGLVSALVAILFQFALMSTERLAWSVDLPFWTRPVIGGLMVGAIAVFWPQVLGVGYDSTDLALKAQFPISVLLALLLAKMAATAITLASRFGGGVFSPSLYLGAMAGGAFGIAVAHLFPATTSGAGLYATLGMGGVAAAVLGAPISTTLIAFELSGDYHVTIALLLVVSIATGLSQAIHGRSFFHWQLETRGLVLQHGPQAQIMRRLRVADFATSLEEGERPEPLGEGEGEERPWLLEDDTVEAALRAFARSGRSRIAVVRGEAPREIIAWADQVEALRALNAALIEAHEEEHR